MSQLDLTIFSTNFISSLILFFLFLISFSFVISSILKNLKFRDSLYYGEVSKINLPNNRSISQIKELLEL